MRLLDHSLMLVSVDRALGHAFFQKIKGVRDLDGFATGRLQAPDRHRFPFVLSQWIDHMAG
jgi:hypothetical protein